MKRFKRHDVGAHGMRPDSMDVTKDGAHSHAPLRNMNEQSHGLPEGWVWTTLNDVAEINPKLDKSSIPDDLLVSFVPMPSVGAGDGKIDISMKKPFPEVKKGFTPFQSGDVLFAKITPCMENGKIAIVPELENRYGFGSTEFHVIRPKAEIDARYIYYFVSRLDFRKEAASKMTGAVGQKRVPTDFIRQSQIPFPPFPVQKLIVAEIEKQFSRLDEAVAGLGRVKANLKRYKASVLNAAVEGRLTEEWRAITRIAPTGINELPGRGESCIRPDVMESGADLLRRILAERRKKWEEDYVKKYVGAHGHAPKDDSWKKKYKEPAAPDISGLPELPERWVWGTGEQLFDWSSGKGLTEKNLRPGPYPVYGGNGISGFHDEFLVSEPTLVIGRVGALCGNVYMTKPNSWITDNAIYATEYPSHVSLQYLKMVFSLAGLNRSAAGSGQPFVNQKMLNEVVIPLPPFEEQRSIAAEIDRRLSVAEEIVAVIETNLKRAERMQQAILKKAFEGRLVG